MLLTDKQIENLVRRYKFITPFDESKLSSHGYDLSLQPIFKLPIVDAEEQIIDPFDPPPMQTKTVQGDYIIVPPHSFVLGCSIERLKIPDNILGLCVGRSSYARSAVISHVTPLEAGWEGTVTLEISNTNVLPVKVYLKEEGLTQVIFLQSKEMPSRTYSSKGGRYQNQENYPVQGRRKPIDRNLL